MCMDVNELRNHDAVKSVESDGDSWIVTPHGDAYDKDDHRLDFLLNELNVQYEQSDGTLKVPKGDITV